MNSKEIKIDLREILWSFLFHYKSVVLFSVLFALLFTTVFNIKLINSTREKGDVKTDEDKITIMENELNESDRQSICEYESLVVNSKKTIRELQDSYIYNLDPYEVASCVLVFYIEAEKSAGFIRDGLYRICTDDKTCEIISEKIGIEITPTEMSKLVSYDYAGDELRHNIVCRFYANSIEDASIMKEYYKSELSSRVSMLGEVYGVNPSFSIIDDYSDFGYIQSLYEAKNQIINLIGTKNNELTNKFNSLSDAAKTVANFKENNELVLYLDGNVVENVDDEENKILSLLVKKFVIGFGIAILLCVIILIMKSVYGFCISSTSELSVNFGIVLFGNLKRTRVFSGLFSILDKFIYSNYKKRDFLTFSEENVCENASFFENISFLCNSSQGCNVVFIDFSINNVASTIIPKGFELLGKNVYKYSIISYSSGLKDGFEILSNADDIIVMSELGKTKRSDIRYMLHLLNIEKKNVLGYINII